MKFDELDTMMRKYEDNANIPSGFWLIVRLDGNSFSKLTQQFEKPFCDKFHGFMRETVRELMEKSGFRFIYGYHESDEISLLFHPDDDTHGHKIRKINSLLAARASVAFTRFAGVEGLFDCRTIILPSMTMVSDYFSWRQADALRNGLNSWYYWTLRNNGFSKGKATSAMNGLSVSDKNELLFQYGINFNEVPEWTKRGEGIVWKTTTTIEMPEQVVEKKQLVTLENLSEREDYRHMIREFCKNKGWSVNLLLDY